MKLLASRKRLLIFITNLKFFSLVLMKELLIWWIGPVNMLVNEVLTFGKLLPLVKVNLLVVSPTILLVWPLALSINMSWVSIANLVSRKKKWKSCKLVDPMVIWVLMKSRFPRTKPLVLSMVRESCMILKVLIAKNWCVWPLSERWWLSLMYPSWVPRVSVSWLMKSISSCLMVL